MSNATIIQMTFMAILLSVQPLSAFDLMLADERIEHIHLFSGNAPSAHFSLFLAPAWYDRIARDSDRHYLPPRDDHYFKIGSIAPSLVTGEKTEIEPNFETVKSWSYTHCIPLGVFDDHLLWVNNDIGGITMWRGMIGFNPVDMFGTSKVPLEEKANKAHSELVTNYRAINTPAWMSPVVNGMPVPQKEPQISTMAPSHVFALTGMFDKKLEKGYCVGLSKAGEEYEDHNDTRTFYPTAQLWISAFSAPEFEVSPIRRVIRGATVQTSGGDVTKDRFTHVTAAFFGSIPMIAVRNDRDSSIQVIDYDSGKQLYKSPSRKVPLPEEYQKTPVENLLMAANEKAAYLGIVFTEKSDKESKRFLLFERTRDTTEWKEFARLELPKDSSSPTMCVQKSDLFYAYLQSVVVDNPPETVDKLGKTSLDKKVTIFKHSLNKNAVPPIKE